MFPRFEVLEVLAIISRLVFVRVSRPLLLLLPAALVVSFDAGRRLERLTTLSGPDRLRYALATVESMVLWGTLLVLAARRRGALRWLGSALFVLLGLLAGRDASDIFTNSTPRTSMSTPPSSEPHFPRACAGQLSEHAPGLAGGARPSVRRLHGHLDRRSQMDARSAKRPRVSRR